MEYELTQHAQEVIAERGIRPEWLERVLESPGRTHNDPLDENLEHRFGKIKEYGNRVLRVVINKGSRPIRVVTAYFDRKMKEKL